MNMQNKDQVWSEGETKNNKPKNYIRLIRTNCRWLRGVTAMSTESINSSRYDIT